MSLLAGLWPLPRRTFTEVHGRAARYQLTLTCDMARSERCVACNHGTLDLGVTEHLDGGRRLGLDGVLHDQEAAELQLLLGFESRHVSCCSKVASGQLAEAATEHTVTLSHIGMKHRVELARYCAQGSG